MRCPGKYCGIRPDSIGNSSICGPCPWGSRVNRHTFECDPCKQNLIWHDWMYLAFVAVLPALIHSFYHEITVGRASCSKLWPIHYIYLLLETVLSISITIVLLPPIGSFHLNSCGVWEFFDWYPMFNNPTTQSHQTLHCSHEVVYPLYSLPFVFYAIWFLFSVGIRPILSIKLKPEAIGAIGPSLYFCPLMVAVHAVCAGLIYYSFPYIVIIASLSTTAVLLANFPVQTVCALTNVVVAQPRHGFILLALLLLNILGLFSLFSTIPNLSDMWVLVMVPAPVIFYILTVPFSDPSKLALSTQ